MTVKRIYLFDNLSMVSSETSPETGKVTKPKSFWSVGTSEESARKEVSRGLGKPNQSLSEDYSLVKVEDLGVHWNFNQYTQKELYYVS